MRWAFWARVDQFAYVVEDSRRKAAKPRQQELGENHHDTLKSYSTYAVVLWR
jgi:hypothetical protein